MAALSSLAPLPVSPPVSRVQLALASTQGVADRLAWRLLTHDPSADVRAGAQAALAAQPPAVTLPAASATLGFSAPATHPAADQVVALVNAERTRHGLSPLRSDARLTTAAAQHSAQMAARGAMAHEGIGDGTPSERLAAAGVPRGRSAENVAMGQQSPESVVDSWLRSPGHRANILDPKLTRIGVAVAVGADGAPYWTQSFAG